MTKMYFEKGDVFKLSKIKAVVFDLGGVLLEPAVLQMITSLSNELGIERRQLVGFFKEHEEDRLRGNVSEILIFEKAENKFDIKIEYKTMLWLKTYQKYFKMRAEMFEVVSFLIRRKCKVGLLSNIDKATAEYIRYNMPLLFDEVVFSCNTGFIKPERQIYEMVLNKLQIFSEHVIMIDDRIENIEGAEAIGMQGILYTNFIQFKNDLEKYLEITLSSE